MDRAVVEVELDTVEELEDGIEVAEEAVGTGVGEVVVDGKADAGAHAEALRGIELEVVDGMIDVEGSGFGDG
ncbi:hypothetical protein HDU97_006006 [Phlyctochytrium planicorne]|nr:hypothetical protein HDU97_006006 [Phlyctochytrium planicorne]